MRIILIYNTERTMSNKEETRQIDNAYRLDKALANPYIFWRRVHQLAHHPNPNKFAPHVLNYLNPSIISSDFPLNPLLEDELPLHDKYYRNRLEAKSKNNLLKHLETDFNGQSSALCVNDMEHALHILGESSQKNLEKKLISERELLQAKLTTQGEVANFSWLTKYWLQTKSPERVFKHFKINLDEYRHKPLFIKKPIDSIDALLNDEAFQKFIALKSSNTSYLTLFPKAVKQLLEALKESTNVQTLSLIRHFGKQATKNSDNPVEFTKFIYLIFEEIKVLLTDEPYSLDDFRNALTKFFPDAETFYAQSGSNALSSIVYALYQQKNAKLNVLTIGSKYFEEPIALKHTGHQIFTDDQSSLDKILDVLVSKNKQIDLLRIDAKAAANGRRHYNTYDILETIKTLIKKNLCSDIFSVAIDRTLDCISSKTLKCLIKKLGPRINVVYFSSGVKTYCLGIVVATFGWIAAYNQKDRFEKFNSYLQARSEHNVKDNPDFQWVTHLYTHCNETLQTYQETLQKQTDFIYNALCKIADMASRENNKVPYLEFFGRTDVEKLKETLKESILRYRGSFGFPYPTWAELERKNTVAIRINCGLLTEKQTESLVQLLTQIFSQKASQKTCITVESEVELPAFKR